MHVVRRRRAVAARGPLAARGAPVLKAADFGGHRAGVVAAADLTERGGGVDLSRVERGRASDAACVGLRAAGARAARAAATSHVAARSPRGARAAAAAAPACAHASG